MWQWYVSTVSGAPLMAAFVQFAILGMVGEWVSARVRGTRLNVNALELVGKMIAWGLMGFVIKVAFTGFHGFTESLFRLFNPQFKYDVKALPGGTLFFFALVKSACTNAFFGPQMMLFHRWEDNLVLRRKGYQGIGLAIKTLFWFWIPAHTITFIIPNHDVQVGLAALWSVVLGLILGLTLGRRPAVPQHAPAATTAPAEKMKV